MQVVLVKRRKGLVVGCWPAGGPDSGRAQRCEGSFLPLTWSSASPTGRPWRRVGTGGVQLAAYGRDCSRSTRREGRAPRTSRGDCSTAGCLRAGIARSSIEREVWNDLDSYFCEAEDGGGARSGPCFGGEVGRGSEG